MWWERVWFQTDEKMAVYKILIEKPEGMRYLGRRRHR
jgi:hypothetical protein